mgnify:CR=1 FL=1
MPTDRELVDLAAELRQANPALSLEQALDAAAHAVWVVNVDVVVLALTGQDKGRRSMTMQAVCMLQSLLENAQTRQRVWEQARLVPPCPSCGHAGHRCSAQSAPTRSWLLHKGFADAQTVELNIVFCLNKALCSMADIRPVRSTPITAMTKKPGNAQTVCTAAQY